MALQLLQFAAQFWEQDGTARGVAVQLNKSSQLMPLMRIQNMGGITHEFGREVTGGEIVRRSINMPFPAAKRRTVTPDKERIEIAGAPIETDHRLVSATNGGARGQEIATRTRTLGRYIDRQLLNGGGKKDQTQIIGLRDRIPNGQTKIAGDNGAQLTLAMFEDFIDLTEDQGSGRFVIAPLKLARKLKRLIVEEASGALVSEVTSEQFSYEGVRIVPAGRDDAGADLLQFNETQGNSDVTASMYCIAPSDDDNAGTNILMASNSIEVIEEGFRGGMWHDHLEVAFGVCVFINRSISRLKGVLAPA